MSVRALTTSEERWIEKHGMDQLDQLNAMERGQDSTTWSTNALHSATNGVLIVASVTALNHPDWWILLVLLGILGSFISTAWFLIILRAHRYEDEWLFRARWLQRRLAIAPHGAIWQEPGSIFRPTNKESSGISSYKVLVVLISGFYAMWVGIVTTSLLLGSSIVLAAIAVISGVIAYYYLFLIQHRKAKMFLEHVEDALNPHSEEHPISPEDSGNQGQNNCQSLNSKAGEGDEAILENIKEFRSELREHFKADRISQYLFMLFTSGLAVMGFSAISEKNLVNNPGLFFVGFIALATGSFAFFAWGLYEIWKQKMHKLFGVIILLASALFVYALLTSW